MAIHCCYRKTNDSNYIAVGSYIKIPYGCNYRAGIVDPINDPEGHNYNGAYPEFFHGMYTRYPDTTIGVDSGIGYINGQFKIIVWSYPNMFLSNTYGGPQWFSKVININKGDIIILRTYLNNNKFITQVDDANGNEIDRIEITCASTKIYNKFLSGVEINRENSIAINQKNGTTEECNDTPAVYFKGVEFYRTTLTTTSYSYVPLTNQNSHLSHTNNSLKFTGRVVDFPYYDDTLSRTMVSGFIKDTVSATSNSNECPI